MDSEFPVQIGQVVTTKHGETLTVLEVKQHPPVTKKGAIIREGQILFRALSGESECWFPVSSIAAKETVDNG